MPGAVLDATDAAVNRTDKSPCPREGQADHQQNRFVKYNVGQMEVSDRRKGDYNLKSGSQEDPAERVQPEQTPEGSSQGCIQGKSIAGRRSSKCKGPEVGVSLLCSRNS